MTGEDRLSRDRLAELADALDAVPTEAEVGAAVALVVTATETVYPATAHAFYYCTILTLSGNEAEGASGSTAAPGGALYALNVGTAVPPAGTSMLAVQVGDRWVINYNG